MMVSENGKVDALSEQLLLRAAYLKELGLGYFVERPEMASKKGSTKDFVSVPSARNRQAAPPQKEKPPPTGLPPLPEGMGPEERLRAIRDSLGECTRCRLCQKRTQIVFGTGSAKARLMFIGEGPGEEEDRQGIPFVGRAGQLLTDIITRGMRLRREDVYIANVVKCRPPQNRDPEQDEIDACYPFLRAQVDAIRPDVIVTLGRPASHTLLGPGTPISRLRGRWASYDGIPVMPTFHPSYLLRNTSAKKDVWEDIQKVMLKLGIEIEKK